jgi:hypothetical protein
MLEQFKPTATLLQRLIEDLSEAVGTTLKSVDILREDAEERRQEFEEYKVRTDANLTSLNAAVERLENLFSYMLR